MTSGGMPVPVSLTHSDRYCPGRHFLLAGEALIEPVVGGLDGQPAAIGHGVAGVDAQVEQRAFELVLVDQVAPQPGGADHLELHGGPDGAAHQLLDVRNQAVEVGGLGIQRLPARRTPAGGASARRRA